MGRYSDILDSLPPITGRTITDRGDAVNSANIAELGLETILAQSPLVYALMGGGFFVGTNLISSTSNVRATIENPSSSTKVLIVPSFIAVHSASGILPGELQRNPTTNLPTTVWNSINVNLGNAETSAAIIKVDTGAAMSGGVEGAFLPTVGNGNNTFTPPAPIIIHPGQTIGLNFAVGTTLSSADVMVAASYGQVNKADLDALLALLNAHNS